MPRDSDPTERFDYEGQPIPGASVADYSVKLAMVRLLSTYRLSAAALRVGIALIWFANTGTGECFPGRARIRDEAGGHLSPDAIRRAVRQLTETRLLSQKHEACGKGIRCVYSWRWDVAQALARDLRASAVKYAPPTELSGPRKSTRAPLRHLDTPGEISCPSPSDHADPPREISEGSKKKIPDTHPGNGGSVVDAPVDAPTPDRLDEEFTFGPEDEWALDLHNELRSS